MTDIETLKTQPRTKRIQTLFDITPTDYQTKLLNYGETKPRAQTAPKKGRQVGATLTAGMIGADHALTHANTDVLYAAPSQGTADEMFREFKKLFWNSPVDDWRSFFGVKEDNKQTWELENGTRILSRTLGNVEQKNNSGNRGFSPTCVIIDEAGYEKPAVYTEEIEPFFITHPEYEFHLFSTPAPNGYFEEKVEVDGVRTIEETEGDDFAWYSPYWPTEISPFAQADYIEKKRQELDRETFRQEFLGEFPDDSGSAIPHSTLIPNLNPDAPKDPNLSRYLGVDPARSGKDELVAFDIDSRGVCWNIWAFPKISGPRFVNFLKAIHLQGEYDEPTAGVGVIPDTGYDVILIEENGVGGFAADFAEAGLGSVVKVFTSTNKSKQDMYQRLIKDLEDEGLALPNHEKLIKQTTKLEKTFTPTGKAKYSHPSGGHDDWPDGMALANYARHGHGESLVTNVTYSSGHKPRSGRVGGNI